MKRRSMIKRVLIAVAMAGLLVGMSAPTTTIGAEGPSRALPTATSVSAYAQAGPFAPTRVDDQSGYVDMTRVYGQYLPTNRWQVGSSGFHGRFDQFLQNDVIAFAQRNITQGMGMMAGNGIYVATQGILTFGLDLQPLNALGVQADAAAATIGVALLQNSPVVVAILVLIIGSVFFQMARTGARPWKKLGTAAMVVALFGLMIAGAQGSTVVNGDFKPGFGSPGWFATQINNSISTIATVPAQALSIVSPVGSMNVPVGTGCNVYMENLNANYTLGYGNSAKNSGIVPQIISSLWASTGLTVWKQTQYGSTPYDETGATYGDSIFCHQLDWQSGVSPKQQAKMTFGSTAAATAAGFPANSAAWGSNDNNKRDQSLVAWAACVNDGSGGFTVRDGFQKTRAGDTWITANNCRDWASSDRSVENTAFNVSGKAVDVYDKTDDPAVINFLTTLHGNDTNGGLILIWTYVLSAVVIFIVFGLLGIAITIAKFAAVVMVVSIFFVLLMSLLARQDMSGKLMQFLKTYLGYTVFAFGATLILAMVTLLSKMVSDTGIGVFGPGSIMSLLFTGMSPVIACWLLHMVFTRLFKIPGIFKPSSAFAWGAAGGAVGGAIGSGIANRLEGRGSGLMRRAGKSAAARAGDYVTGGAMLNRGGGKGRGGRPVRRGTMSPGGVGEVAASGALADTAAAVAIAAGDKISKKELRRTKFDKTELLQARRFHNGINPGASRMDAFAQRAGQSIHRVGQSIQRGRIATAEQRRLIGTAQGRAELRARGATAIGSMRGNLTRSISTVRDIGATFGAGTAAKYVAEQTGAAAWRGTKAAGQVAVRGTKAAGQVAVHAAQYITADTASRGMAKIGAGALAGMVLAGPVGAVIGGGIGLARAHRGINIHNTQTNAKLISDYAAHKDSIATESAEAAKEDKKARVVE